MTAPEPLLSMPVYQPVAHYSDTTRALCCAAYVDSAFGNDVIEEVIENERKAVPPSFGFDLDPVARHCLRARRLMLARHLTVTALLIVGFWANPVWTAGWLVVCALILGVRSPAFRRLPRWKRIGFSVAAFFLILCIAGSALADFGVTALFARFGPDISAANSAGYGETLDDRLMDALNTGQLVVSLVAPLVLAAVMWAALYLFRRQAYVIIAAELAPGAPATIPRSSNPRVERRLAAIAAMQRGNISIHDTYPYTGAGDMETTWSFAISLKNREQPGERVRLDVAGLNRHVTEAILALRSPSLTEGERIPNLYVVPYVAANGNRRGDDPLIDRAGRLPLTQASAETIAAIEICPQGGLRHYLRAVIPASGKEIRTPDGRTVLHAQDSGIGVTAFVHLAVEGGLLYAEFVVTVMPDLQERYKLADYLVPSRVSGRAVADTFRLFLHDNLYGPAHLARTAWNAMWLSTRMSRSAARADEFRYYDYGARFSVRERAAVPVTENFLQRLDAAKYTKLLSKTVTQSLIGYLHAHGVDTDEFETVVNQNIQFPGAVFSGGVQNFGGRNIVSQVNNSQVQTSQVQHSQGKGSGNA